jgi:uncharacterized protein
MTSTVLTRRSPFADPHLRDVAARIAALDWQSLAAALDTHGCATTGPLLTPEECAALRELYAAEAPFRSRIVMARHGFGRGEYKYFSYPLPQGTRGIYRVSMRHGVSRLRSGSRHTLGVIFHDAK